MKSSISKLLSKTRQDDFNLFYDYRTTQILFTKSGSTHYGDWQANLQDFKNILSAISNCGLKNSIKDIGIQHCNVGEETARSLFEEYGLTGIKVTGKANDYENDFMFTL